MSTVQQTGGYALLEFNSMSIVLPAEVAAQAFALLCHGEVVEYHWGDKRFKRNTDPHRTPSLKVFTLAQYAALALEDPAD